MHIKSIHADASAMLLIVSCFILGLRSLLNHRKKYGTGEPFVSFIPAGIGLALFLVMVLPSRATRNLF
jgi:hypothetical protein